MVPSSDYKGELFLDEINSISSALEAVCTKRFFYLSGDSSPLLICLLPLPVFQLFMFPRIFLLFIILFIPVMRLPPMTLSGCPVTSQAHVQNWTLLCFKTSFSSWIIESPFFLAFSVQPITKSYFFASEINLCPVVHPNHLHLIQTHFTSHTNNCNSLLTWVHPLSNLTSDTSWHRQ